MKKFASVLATGALAAAVLAVPMSADAASTQRLCNSSTSIDRIRVSNDGRGTRFVNQGDCTTGTRGVSVVKVYGYSFRVGKDGKPYGGCQPIDGSKTFTPSKTPDTIRFQSFNKSNCTDIGIAG